MYKFHNKLINDANTIFKKHQDWLKVRDEYITKGKR